ncbi:major facilitator superfamily MFS_1 [Syntrophobotulus glycolicus DSM 8271]|uniref:Major facilitator superfamily MFS_1 n=1 Tax=Syntrophobotulus glycolicus (strain DSM 8271 / FlGlyR) TaxID=645991 RepID=F0SXV2_SYNGF|nr:MFS transporter [Syntrophobotulus glycolicus]ADY57013.1 major facilitator superfamily MFS_1 [Syntrophobotulus glycolicus DSM 8271]
MFHLNQKKTGFFNKQISFFPYHWLIVLTTFFTLVLAAGIRSTPSVLMVPFQVYFGWSRAEISLAVAINLLLYGFCGPFAAALMELYGTRRVVALALLLLSAGTSLTAWVKAPWQMVLLWGIVVGIGTGFLATVLGTVIAQKWFDKHRGLILGIFSAAGATGQLIFLPLFSKLLQSFSWQVVVWLLSGAALAVMVLVIIVMRNNPGDIGLLPYGASETADLANSMTKGNPFLVVLKGLKTAVYSKEFWLLSASFFVCGATTSGLIGTHFIAACIDHGITEIYAAGMLSVAGVFNIFGVTFAGWLSDRLDNRWLLFWYYILRGVSLVLLPFTLEANHLSIVFFIVFYGLDWSATLPSTVRLAANIFGRQGIVIFGWMMAIHQVGSAAAAFYAGALHTIAGSYHWAFISAGLLCLMASGIVILIRR